MEKLPAPRPEASLAEADVDPYALTVEQLSALQFGAYPDRLRSLLWFGFEACLAVFCLAIPVAWALGYDPYPRRPLTPLGAFLMPFLAAFAASAAQGHLRGVLRPSPRVLIDREGVWDREHDPPRIPWARVTRVEFDSEHRLAIELGDGARLETAGLGADLDRMVAVLEQYHRRWRELEAAPGGDPGTEPEPDKKTGDAGAGSVLPLIRLV